MKKCLYYFLFLQLTLCLWAEPIAVIEYVSKDNVTIFREGQRYNESEGFELNEGDQVQTDNGVFAEIKIYNGNSLLKLSENTIFVLSKISNNNVSLKLIYGRVRSKVSALSGDDSFNIVTNYSTAGVRGTDFGVDLILSSGQTKTNTYCFEGSVEVSAKVISESESKENLEPMPTVYTITPGQMVSVIASSDSVTLEKDMISEEIKAFWKENDYVAKQIVQPIEEEITITDEEPSTVTIAKKEDMALSEEQKNEIFKNGYTAAEKYYLDKNSILESQIEQYKKRANIQMSFASLTAYCGAVAIIATAIGIVGYSPMDDANKNTITIAAASFGITIPLFVFSIYPDIFL